MKVLLSNPPWFPEEGRRWGIRAGSRWPFTAPAGFEYYPYPFLLGHAASTLQSQGIDGRMVDSILTRESMASYMERLKHVGFDYVVIETSTPSIEWDLDIAEKIHSMGSRVILAGPHATVFSEDLVSLPYIHSVLKGTYELNLLDAVNTGEPGVYDYKFPEDVDSLPFPHRDTTCYRYSDRFPVTPPGPSLQLWGSRGCPHRCVFCLWPPVMYQNRYMPRSPAAILQEVREVLGRLPRFTSLYFDDDTFNVGDRRMKELCTGLKEIGLPWAAMCRADTVSLETFEAMRDAGCYAVKLGVESGCQELVNRCNKKLDLKTVEKVVQGLKKMGVFVHLTFTFGLPGETRETIRETRSYFRRLKPDTAQESFCTPFPGTPFYELLKKSGQLGVENWSRFDGARSSIVAGSEIPSDELLRIGRLHTKLFVWGAMREQHMGPWLVRAAAKLGYVPVIIDCLGPSCDGMEGLFDSSPLDIFLVDKGSGLTPEILSRIKAKKILYYPDILPQPEGTNEHAELRYGEFSRIAPFFDHVVLHDGRSVPWLEQRGHKNISGRVVLPFGANLHRPLELPKLHDVTFIGLPSPYRLEWLDFIGRRVPVHNPTVWGEEFVRTVNQSRILLNLHYTPLLNTEHRIIETMACGGFVMSEALSWEGLFEDRKEIVFFDRKNVFDLLAFYLEHPEERAAVASAGHDRVKRDFETVMQLRKILELCGERVG